MSIVSLLLRQPQRRIGPTPGPPGGGLLLDAVINESYTKEADVSVFPIEIGAEISDHVIPKPAVYIMTGVVTDNPLQWFATSYQHTASSTRHLSAFAILLDLMTSRQSFDIDTGYLQLKDVVLSSITSEKTATTAHELNFEATLLVLNIVDTQLVPLTAGMVLAGNPGEQAAPEVDAGTKTGTPPATTLATDVVNTIKELLSGLGF